MVSETLESKEAIKNFNFQSMPLDSVQIDVFINHHFIFEKFQDIKDYNSKKKKGKFQHYLFVSANYTL